jgi:hypothetical protein
MGQRSQTERLASVMQDLVMKYSFKIGRNKLQLLIVIQMKSYMTVHDLPEDGLYKPLHIAGARPNTYLWLHVQLIGLYTV